jgi:hypothetical protein
MIIYTKQGLRIRFRSILECGYAIYLDKNPQVKSWNYETSWIWYIDGFTGKERKYICDFKIEYVDGRIEHVEVKPLDLQYFSDKYLYAQYQLQGWRWITKEEIQISEDAFSKPKLSVEFIINHPSNINNRAIIDLDLDEILECVKKDISVKQIGIKFNVNYRTIIKFLEDRSYVIRWCGTSSKHNEIRHATKLIWPLEELPPRKVVRNRVNHKWDNQQWLYQKYINEKLATRIIGKSVGVSGRLILKKLRKYNIETRSVNGR